MATSEVEGWRREQGWDLEKHYPYELNVKGGDDNFQAAVGLAKESEVLILGSAPEVYVSERMKAGSEGITFRYSERIFKRGTWRFLSPRGLLGKYHTYYKYHNRKLFMLCASAYTSGDFRLQGCYLGKCYKWGYFPETRHYDPEELMKKKQKDKVELLWCGRFIHWKHPEAAISLASILKREGVNFTLKMIGTGEEEKHLKTLITDNKLQDYVILSGAMSPDEVRDHMEGANIFLFTSDFQEGWGAVLNEAMNSGCAVVASHAAGAVPYLIKDRENGFIYRNGDLNSLCKKVKLLINDRQVRENLGIKAYETVIQEWNAQTAAERFLLLVDDLIHEGKSDRFLSGPCSSAEILRNNWYSDSYVI